MGIREILLVTRVRLQVGFIFNSLGKFKKMEAGLSLSNEFLESKMVQKIQKFRFVKRVIWAATMAIVSKLSLSNNLLLQLQILKMMAVTMHQYYY